MPIPKDDRFLDVMVDLETTGQAAGCPILSIGAVAFNHRQMALGPDLYCEIALSSCHAVGLVSDPRTLDWWGQQSVEARQVLDTTEDGLLLVDGLEFFQEYLQDLDPSLGSVRVWGNGSDFDNAILSAAYTKLGRATPWKFWNNKCFRTLKGLVPGIKSARFGLHHHALDDAVHQAQHAMLLQHLGV